MIQKSFNFPIKREGLVVFVPGSESESGLAELHFTDADGVPSFMILPVRAQHELLNALVLERREDIARGMN